MMDHLNELLSTTEKIPLPNPDNPIAHKLTGGALVTLETLFTKLNQRMHYSHEGRIQIEVSASDGVAKNIAETLNEYIRMTATKREGIIFRFCIYDERKLDLLFTLLKDIQPNKEILWVMDSVQKGRIYRYDNPRKSTPLLYTCEPFAEYQEALQQMGIGAVIDKRLTVNVGKVVGRTKGCYVSLFYKKDSLQANTGMLSLTLGYRLHSNGVEVESIVEQVAVNDEEFVDPNEEGTQVGATAEATQVEDMSHRLGDERFLKIKRWN